MQQGASNDPSDPSNSFSIHKKSAATNRQFGNSNLVKGDVMEEAQRGDVNTQP